MALTTADFATFFTELYGHEPFAWQLELLDTIAATGNWPDRVAAPTGSGKTSVIDVHAFVNALAQQDDLRLPRRLIMTVNRRSLIDDHAEHAARLAAKLSDAATNAEVCPVTARVAHLLVARAGGRDEWQADAEPLTVHTVRGGVPLQRGWLEQLTSCSVLCMTPDMWGSRALFRGYGTSTRMRPVEAALVVMDAVLVVDEAHLNRQLLVTARRIAQIQSFSNATIGVPDLQVVETTATPTESPDALQDVGIRPQALGAGPAGDLLKRRLATPKPLIVRPIDDGRNEEAKVARALVEACLELWEDERFVRAPIGCVVNTVSLAKLVSASLSEARAEGFRTLEVIGGLRPYDRDAIKALYPPLAQPLVTEPGEAQERAVDFIVGTQALEVGIDIDLSALVTELAPAAAIVQRAGRVNRRGASEHAAVIVVAPAYDENRQVGPYEHADLTESLKWLKKRSGTSFGLAPLALYDDPPPSASPRRVLFQRLEPFDAVRLARTSEDTVFAERALNPMPEDLTLWLRDDLDDRVEAAAVIRDFLPLEAQHARRVADVVKPLGDEVYSLSLGRVRNLARELKDNCYGKRDWLLVYRRNAALLLDEPGELLPGDVLVVPPGVDVLQVTDRRESRRKLSEHGDINDLLVARQHLPGKREAGPTNALQYRQLLPAADVPESGEPVNGRLERVREAAERVASPDVAAGLAGDLTAAHVELLDALLDWSGMGAANSGEKQEVLLALRERLLGPGEDVSVEVTVLLGNNAADEIFVLVRSAPLSSGDSMSERAPRNVYLDDHSEAVESRVRAFAEALSLTGPIRDTVTLAGRHHDDGKAHDRFQQYLTYRWPSRRLLAKSKYVLPRELRAQLGLVGWRHEQLSAAYVWELYRDKPATVRALITWLVGVSHGHGRGYFDADAAALLLGDDHSVPTEVVQAAVELFDVGEWDDLFSNLLEEFGPWGAAFLESLVRLADGTVSGEGR